MYTIVYAGILLEEAFRKSLLNLTRRYWQATPATNIYGDHVTLAFGQWVTNEHRRLVGTRTHVFLGKYVVSSYLSCITVTLKPALQELCINKYAHVTISTEAGHKPVESNDVLEAYFAGDSKVGGIPLPPAYMVGTCGLFVREDNGKTRWVIGSE